MVHIAICDDEKYMSDRIRKMVSDFFRKKNMEVAVSQFMAGEELLKYSGKIDILFLDIRMGDGNINGMETARKLRSRNFKGFLLFITILEEMVFQSFEVQAYDYLVKPVENGRFEKTMERLFLSMRSAGDTGLLVQKGNEGIIVPFDDIVFCEVIDRKVYLHLKPSGVLDYYERIESLEKKLGSRFFRCHRSYLVHLKYLKSYKNGTACMVGGMEIPVSRLRDREFSRAVMRYMKEWGL